MTSIDEHRITYRDMRSNLEVIADEDVKERVLAGIEVLNEQYGPDWVDHIDPRSLILSSSTSCVLGQLYDKEARRDGNDGFDYGYQKLGIHTPYEYGFDTDEETYTELTNAWRVAFGLPEVEDEDDLG